MPTWRSIPPRNEVLRLSYLVYFKTERGGVVSTLHRSKPNTPSPGYALRSTNPNALSHVPTEELLLELRRRIVAPRDRRRDTWDDFDGGLDPQGDWPDEG